MNPPAVNIPALLRRYGLHARKGFGQNFLSDPQILGAIVTAAELPCGMPVLEIGPGLGTLTRTLLAAGAQVTAVELDAALAGILEDQFTSQTAIQIVRGDILRLDPSVLMGERESAVVANIPYNITSAIFRHLLEARLPPRRIVLTVQQEVAERICALPGDLSLLALSVQVYGSPRVCLRVPASAFYPPPRVNSAVVRVDPYERPLVPTAQRDAFFRLARAGFSQKRKTLRNSLAGGLGIDVSESEALLRRASIEAGRRAETLSIAEWLRLVETMEPAARLSRA